MGDPESKLRSWRKGKFFSTSGHLGRLKSLKDLDIDVTDGP